MMKKILFFMSVMGVAASAFGSSQELFLNANRQYRQGDYRAALDGYESIEPKGPGVWFNIGKCYGKLGDRVMAAVSFHRACQSGTSWQLYARSADALSEYAHDFQNSTKRNWFAHQAEYWLAPFSLLLIQLIFLLFWFFSLGALYAVRTRRFWVRAVVFLLFGVMLVCATRALQVKYEHQCITRCMATENTMMRSGPATAYDSLSQLNRYERARVLDQHDNWYKVATENGAGWVPAVAVIVI